MSPDEKNQEQTSSQQPLDNNIGSSSPTPQPQPLAGQTIAPSPSSNPPLSAPSGAPAPFKKSNTRYYLLALIVVLVFAAVIWSATKLSDKNQPTSTLTKHSVALLRVASAEPLPTGFFPASANDAYSFEVNAQVFEGLTKFVNQTQVAPNLATSWTNPNNDTWVFQLKQGVKFHDGNTLTSKEVVDSLTQVKNAAVGSIVPYTIKTVTAQGPNTVQITTSQPDPLLDRELTQFWIWDTSNTKNPNSADNGTGPFTLKPGTSISTSLIQLDAYNNYQGGHPTVGAINFYTYGTGQQLVDGLKQNKIDLADLTTQAGFAPTAKNAGFSLLNINDPLVYYIIPNTLKKGSPLQNLKVRQAIYMSIDPTLLAYAHNNDIGAPATQLVPPSIPGYDPTIKRPPINIAAAKALLSEAGYPNGLTLGFTYYSPAQDKVATELQKEMATIGIKLNLDPQTDGNALFSKISSGNVDMYVVGDSSQILDTSDVAGALVIDTPEYSNAKVDSLYTQAQQTFDAKTRLQLLQQLNTTVMNDLGVFPIDTPINQYFAYRPGLVLQQQYLGGVSGLYYWQIYSNK
jgi:peptide/nickel transport system substrate-binding protein